ncbi:MAG: hypothetical protein ACREC6_00935 [Hyphomicrobiaceae bacterium]
MSTTIEGIGPPRRFGWMPYAAMAVGVRSVLLLAIAAFVEPTRDAVVLGPPVRTLQALAGSDTRIVDIGAVSVFVRGMEPGFVRALYANGAWLVLPARAGGCRNPGARRP